MKKYIFCLFLLALGGEIQAQVTCGNCNFKLSGGTQVLAGGNLYGATAVSSGTLRLQGNSLLDADNAGDTYRGILDIANVSAGTRPAVFEHNGNKTQVFAGNITNSGSGNILGAFVQSGNGKTIITGAKDFAGTISVTGGFLGGAGDLSKTKSATVAEGSIGGGLGVEANGATLTVSGLNFSSAASKLIVTSLSATDNNPSLLEVKTAGLPSPITAANNFTVSLVGANLTSGYILKCSNGVSDRLPLPTLVGDLAERACLAWDATGLFLRISAGSITLTTTTVCPRGVNSTNSQIIITAQYGDAHDYLPQGATGTFSLSNEAVKSGDLTTTRVNDATVTATFNGVNAATTDIPYKVVYTDEKNCGATLETRINPQPALSVSSGGNPNCKGTPIVLQAVGHGAVTISPVNADQATVTPNATPTLSATATALVVGNITFLATDNAGCKSEFLSVAVKDIPVMNSVAAGDALAVCKGQAQPPIPLVSEGAGDAKADAYNWQLKSGNTIYDVGLADYTTQPPTETSIPSFTPLNSTTTLQSRDVIVTPFNRGSGCYGAPKELKITVGPIPIISLDNSLLKACSGETITTLITKSATGSWLTTDAGGTSNSIGTTVSPEGSITAGAVTSEQAILQDISLQSGNCISNSIRLTINPKPTVSLADPNFIICGSMSNVKIPLHTGNGLLAATGYKWKQSGDLADVGLADKTDTWSTETNITIPSTPAMASTTPATTRGMVLTPYSSTTGCTGSDYVWKITLNPALIISLDNSLLKACSGENIPTLITKSAAGSWLTTDAGGTANSIGTTVSPEGSITAGAVASEQAVLQDISLQSGNCISNSIRLTINPKPIVSLADPNFIICGSMSNVKIPLHTGNGLLAATGYKWKQSGDPADVGLADKTDNWSAGTVTIPSTPTTTTVTTRGMVLTPYNSTTGCSGSDYVWKITLNPDLIISLDNALLKACSGETITTLITKSAAGSWLTTDVGGTANSIGTSISPEGSITVGAVTSEQAVLQDISLQSGNCISNSIRLTINPKPTVSLTDPNFIICGNMSNVKIPLHTGNGLLAATGYKWKQSGDLADVGLADKTDTWSTETNITIPSTPAMASTTPATTRGMVLTPYNSATGCTGSDYAWKITLNPDLIISLDNSLLKACSGETITTLITKSAAGSWLTTDAGGTTNSIGTSISPEGSITAGTVTSEQAVLQDISLQSGNCISNSIRLTINPKPTVSLADPNFIICGSMSNVKIPLHTGNGLLAATGYKWKQSGDGLSDVGLADKTDTWSTETNITIPSTPAMASTTPATTRGMILTPYNSATGCTGSDYVWKITLNPDLIISLDNSLLKACSGETITTLITKSATGSWLTTDVGGTANSIGTTISPEGSITAGVVTSEQAVLQDISLQSGNCISNSIRLTINPKPTVSLADPNFIICGNMSNVKIPLHTGNGLLAATGYKWKQSGDLADVGLADKTDTWSTETNITIPSTPAMASTTPATTRGMVLTPYNSTTGCAGSDYVWKITLNPNLIISLDNALLKACSGETIATLITKSAAGSWLTTDVGGTANSIGTTISPEGSITAGAVASEQAVLQDISLQSGNCISNSIRLTINPKPIVSLTDPNFIICGNMSNVKIPLHTGNGLLAATGYKWKQSGDLADVGLADKTDTWSTETNITIPSTPATTTATTRGMVLTPYNSATGCAGSDYVWKITLNPNLIISLDNSLLKACSGETITTLITKSATANSWLTTDVGGTANSIGTSISPEGSITAGAVASEQAVLQDISLQSGNCISNSIRLTINPKPTVSLTNPNFIICGNMSNVKIPLHTGNGLLAATGYKWKQSGDLADVGLADKTDTWSTETNITIPSTPTTTTATTRGMVLTPYNSTTGCAGSDYVWKITLNPDLIISLDNALAKACSGETITTLITKSATGSWLTTDVGGTANSIGTNISPEGSITAGAVASEQAVLQDISLQSGNCISNSIRLTINPKPIVSLADPNFIICGNMSNVKIPLHTGNGLLAATGYKWKQSGDGLADVGLADKTDTWSTETNITIPSTPTTTATTTTATTRGMILTPYNSATGCTGSDYVWKITLNPDLIISLDNSLLKACSGETITTLITKSVAGSWLTTDVGGTANSIGTSISPEGSITVGTVASEQAILQDISLQSGNCISNSIRLTINPKPIVSLADPNFIICGSMSNVKIPLHTGNGLLAATGYKWKQSGDLADVGLADKTDTWSTETNITIPSTPAMASTTPATTRGMVLTPYSSATGCAGSDYVWKITLNPDLIISLDNSLLKACSGETITTLITKSATGSWLTTDVGGTTNSIGTNISPEGSITVGAVASEQAILQDISLQSGNCISNSIRLTINPKPIVSLTDPNFIICGSMSNVKIPLHTGNGLLAATGYKWKQSGDLADVGLADKTDTWSTETNITIPSTPAMPATTPSTTRGMVLTPYSSATGCSGGDYVWKITLNPDLIISLDNSLAKACSGETITTLITKSAAGSWLTTDVGGTANSIGTSISPEGSITAGAVASEQAVLQDISLQSGNCISNSIRLTINPKPTVSLADPNFIICGSMSNVKIPLHTGNGLLAATGYKWKQSGDGLTDVGLADKTDTWSTETNITIPSTPAIPATTPVTTRGMVLTPYNSATGCAGSDYVWKITLNPDLIISLDNSLLKACSGETITTLITKSATGSWLTTDAGGTANSIGTTISPEGSITAGAVASEQAVLQDISLQSGNCISNSIRLTINPKPTVSLTDPNFIICGNMSNVKIPLHTGNGLLAATGYKWKQSGDLADVGLADKTDTWSTETNITIPSTPTIPATTPATMRGMVLTPYNSATGCAGSDYVWKITLYPKPTLPEIPDRVYCGDLQISDLIPAPNGEGAANPIHYQWKLAANAVNSSDIGLSDYTEDWTKSAISFTSSNTLPVSQRDITITGYNETLGCTTESQDITITVNQRLKLAFTSLSPICTGVETTILLTSSLPYTTYQWTVNTNNVGAQNRDAASTSPVIQQVLSNGGSSSETVTYTVTGNHWGCTDVVSIPIEVSASPSPVAPTVTGGGEFCANPANNTYQTNLIPEAAEANVEWTYTSYFESEGEGAGGNTQKWGKSSLSAVNDNLALNYELVTFYYIFHPYTGCFGYPSQPISVKVYPAPMAATPVQSYVCSSSAANPIPASITLTGISTPDVVYTWTADKTNAPNVTGYSQPSREGAIVGLQNPPAATTDPIADNLSLTGATPEEEATLGAQTFDYLITPWRQGCPGNVMIGRVTVNPLPIVTPPANRIHCSGVRVETTRLEGINGASEFSWTGGNAVNLSDQPRFGSGNLPRYTTPTVNTPPTQVTIIAKNPNGCISAPTSFTISVMPKPTLSPIAPQALCTGATINRAATITIAITPNPAETTYTWTVSYTDNNRMSRSQLRIIKNNLDIVLPYTEVANQTGNISEIFTANDNDNTTVTFSLTPVSNGCLGNIAKVEVNVLGQDLMTSTSIDNMAADISSGSAANIKVGHEGDGNTYSWKSIDNFGNIQVMDNSGNAINLSNEQGREATVISDILTLKDNNRGNITYLITPSLNGCVGMTTSCTVSVNPP